MLKKLTLTVLISILFFTTGCSDSSSDGSTVTKEPPKMSSSIKLADKDAMYKKASLRETLPSNTFLYTRVPTPAWIFSPAGNALKNAKGNKKYVEQAQLVQKLLHDNITQNMKGFAKDFASFLLMKADGPFEMALLSVESKSEGYDIPHFIFRTHLKDTSIDDINQTMINFTSLDSDDLVIEKKISASEDGIINLDRDAKLIIRFQKNQLTVLLGLVDVTGNDALDKIKLTPNTHKMHKLEKQVDADAKGAFLWLGMREAQPTLENGEYEFRRMWRRLSRSGLTMTDSIAMGWGTANNKTRVKFMVDIGKQLSSSGPMRFAYTPDNKVSIKTVGEPGSVLALALPSKKNIAEIEESLKKEARFFYRNYMQMKDMLKSEIGISADDIYASFDSELLIFSDEAGEFAAIRIGDDAKFNKIIAGLVEKFNLGYEERKIDGNTFYHLTLPSMPALDSRTRRMMRRDPVMALIPIIQGKTHLYWIKSGDYIVLSSIPQPLMDRLALGAKNDLGKYLREQRKQDPKNSLLFASVKVKNVPRYFYHYSIYFLNYLNDVANSDGKDLAIFARMMADRMYSRVEDPKPSVKPGKEFDIFSLPTARQLGLPEDGSIGFQISIDGEVISAEISSEVSPADIIFVENTMVAIAGIGIASAVIIPVLEDIF